MAQVTVNRYSAELGKLPSVCLCCGQPAQRLVRHKFYYDPLWLAILGPLLLGIFRYIWAAQNVVLAVPVCARHPWRLNLPTYMGYVFACSLFGMAPVLFFAGQSRSMGPAMGWFFLLVFLYIVGMLVLMVVVRLASPRMVDFDSGSITFGSVSQGFADAVMGRRAAPAPLTTSVAAMPGQPMSLNPLAANSLAGAYPRAPATSNGPLIALLVGGGGALVLVLGLCLWAGLYVAAGLNRDATARAMHAKSQQHAQQLEADAQNAAQAHHDRVQRDIQAAQQRAAAAQSRTATSTPITPPSTQSLPTFPPTPPSSAAAAAGSTIPRGPFGQAAAAPPAAPSPSSGNAAVPDPFGVGGFGSGAPPISPPVGIPPRPRPDKERAEPRGFSSRVNFDKGPGPDGKLEEVYSPTFQDSPHPPESRPLARVADLKAGAEVWVQSRGRSWVRATVLSVAGLRAKVHYHGSDSESDELVQIPKIRLATDADALAEAAAQAQVNPFEQTVPPRKRTWTDSSGKFSVEAEFVKLAAGKVTLKKNDGTEITMALDKLADADQQIARQLGEM